MASKVCIKALLSNEKLMHMLFPMSMSEVWIEG